MIRLISTACGKCYECMEFGQKLLKAVQSFYEDSKVCAQVGMDVSEWFLVSVGLRQGCVMSPCLCNVYMDGLV